MQFPAMRRLSIATAHAFLLVYATTSAPSFGCVKQCFEEIREQRADFQVNASHTKANTLHIEVQHKLQLSTKPAGNIMYSEFGNPNVRRIFDFTGKLYITMAVHLGRL